MAGQANINATEDAPRDVVATPLPWYVKAGRLFRLMRKELSEILRDRRTIITLILMPILLYPLLTLAFQQFFLAGTLTEKNDNVHRLAYLSEEQFYLFNQFVARANLPTYIGAVSIPATSSGTAPLSVAAALHPKLNLFGLEHAAKNVADLQRSIRTGRADVGIRVRRLTANANGERYGWEIFYREDSPRSRNLMEKLQRYFAQANEGYFATKLATGEVLRIKRVPVDVFEAPSRGLSLAALVPLILILMTITGAVYPAIDLTAGERERGTLEMLVAAPVPRMGLLLAKYVSVLTVALLTALVNLATMMLTLQISGMGRIVFGDGISFATLAMMFGLLLLFASFFSAVLLSLTSFARSFKEAQAYLIPLMLLSLAPGLMGMMPGLKLQGLISIVPLLNIVLLGRDLFQGTAQFATAMVVVATTLLYALGAIAVAARIFGSESVLYSEQRNWADLFRRPKIARAYPTISGVLLLFACLFPASFIMQRMLAFVPPASAFAMQVLITALLFIVIPMLVAVRNRITLTTGFQLQHTSVLYYAGGALLGGALFPFIYEVLVLLRQLEWTLLQPHHEQLIQMQIAMWRSFTPATIVVTFVLTGVLEEFFFRGFLFSAFRSVTGKWTTIFATALLFAAFHFIYAFDRLLPSMLLGVALGWVCWHARSVWPGILLHGCYNGLWVYTAYSAEGIGLTQRHLPASWLLGGAVAGVLGVMLVWLCSPRLRVSARENVR